MPPNKHTCFSSKGKPGIAAHSVAPASSNPGSLGGPNGFFNNSEFGITCDKDTNVEQSTLNESPVINKTNMLMDEAAKIMDQMLSITAQNKKLLATYAAQAKDLEKLNSTCKMKRNSIDTLKALLVDKFDRLRSLDVTGNIEDGDYVNTLRKLEAAVKELREKEQVFMDMEEQNRSLITRERLSNNQLLEARKTLITYIQKFHAPQSTIGIKRMGELNLEPFIVECKKKLDGNDWFLKSMELCSLWREHIKNPQWHPFKIDHENNRFIIDEDDESLKELKDEWGDTTYKAVTDALLEMDEYNPSGRFIVFELWNFEEDRKASLQEAIEHLMLNLERGTQEVTPCTSEAAGKKI